MSEPSPPQPDDASPAERIEDLLSRMTLEERLAFVRGSFDPTGVSTGYVAGIDRLGVPSLSLVDGPMGVRGVPATAFPASIALAAAWDPDLAREFGEALGEEARGADQDVLLAPGCNVVRVPQCGRAFEYYSEDPHLASRLTVGTVEGIQSAGVMATAKHFVANNQETDRHHVSAEVSERALREIYLPAFEAAVTDAEVSSVMASYNRINGTYATEHRRLLTDVLKEEWGFSGFVVSDWWATFDGPAAAEAGLDLEMPGMPLYDWHCDAGPLFSAIDALPDADWIPKRQLAELAVRPWQPPNPNPLVLEESPFDESLRAAIEDGRVDAAVLEDKVRRILREMERFGMLEGERPPGALDTPEHHALARRIAERGTVLLQNDGVLPLDEDADVALVGPHVEEAKVGGGGSSAVDPRRATSPFEGIRDRLGHGGSITVERGIEPVGDASPHDDLIPDLSRLRAETPRLEDAMTAAREADVAVVVVRDRSTEGADRPLDLPGAQNELITAVAAAADRCVVVCNTAGAITMPWLEAVDAVLATWYPGQEDGAALASVLYGDVDPSGRLPVTFGATPEDYPTASEARYPGVDLEAAYDEGVFVGYRHFDAADIEPTFPFGHGLSYTTFEYDDLSVPEFATPNDDGPAATVSVTVENVGDRAGREVVQAYLVPPASSVDRPPKELVAFEPLEIRAGESKTVDLALNERAFAYYDERAGDWVHEPGEYEVLVGRSGRDVRVSESISIEE